MGSQIKNSVGYKGHPWDWQDIQETRFVRGSLDLSSAMSVQWAKPELSVLARSDG